jgi:FMN hydrolase / 5-amino-6-(5-phospho-D-ribitylamino)uracil phosphatase
MGSLLEFLLLVKISDIKLISIDLFQTLVSLDEGRDQIWQLFLQDHYTSELARHCWDRTSEILFQKLYETAIDRQSFKNSRTIIEESYAAIFREINCSFDPRQAGHILIEMHRRNIPFNDAVPFLHAVGKNYKICLSTDCDLEMITDIRKLYAFDKIFVSEELRAYKFNPEFFRQVIRYYQLKPQNILHIGDSQSDIITPKRLGILTCWLNRDDKPWSHEVRPDFKVRSLMDIADILERARIR